jgi:hypothetical protein
MSTTPGKPEQDDLLPLVERVEVFSWWTGFADPPSRAAKLTFTPTGASFRREQALAGPADELPASAVAEFLAALSREPVPQLDPALFDLPERALRSHYDSMWTDDCPGHLVRVTFAAGRVVTVRADAQHAFMLPLKISDEAGQRQTFDPRLSRAIAALMPEGYPERDRLAGVSGMLELNLQEPLAAEEPPGPVNKDLVSGGVDSVVEEIYRIFRREESPRERTEAERAGRLAERLLRRNSLAEVRDLLARGADPSVADEHGQTALMKAASPPVDRERFRLLAQAGADVEARRFDGYTGLHLSCAGGMGEAAEEWVRAGADVQARTQEGATPLMLGAGWPAVVRVLLAAGADVNAADQDGHTALVYAVLRQCWVAAEGHLEAIRLLLAAGADVHRRDREGIAPIEHARRVLAGVHLQDEVRLAFNPDYEPPPEIEWDERRVAEAVCALLGSAGG